MTRHRSSRAAAIAALLAGLALPGCMAAQQGTPESTPLPRATPAQQAGPESTALYTPAQAEAGKVVFESICAKCHQVTLAGKGDAPPLSGKYFANSWGGHKVSEMFDFVKVNMPMDKPGTLDEATYLNAIAYVLSRNGVPAGDTPLAKGSDGVITPKQ
jgi:mono/diheme cytochrome c family protein